MHLRHPVHHKNIAFMVPPKHCIRVSMAPMKLNQNKQNKLQEDQEQWHMSLRCRSSFFCVKLQEDQVQMHVLFFGVELQEDQEQQHV